MSMEMVSGVFSYGTLRADASVSGDEWDLLKDTGGSWKHAMVKGARLYQEHGCTYPFVLLTGNLNDTVFGTLLEWSDKDSAVKGLSRCDEIEGCNTSDPQSSLFQRTLIDVYLANATLAPVKAWIYYQSSNKHNTAHALSFDRCRPTGDWLASRVFHAWFKEQLVAGDSPASIVQRIGAASFMKGDMAEADMCTRLEFFARHMGGKACETIRVMAAQSKQEPGIPFVLWLVERWKNGALAAQVLDLLQLPASPDRGKSDEELWQGLWQLSEESNAWAIIKKMSDGCRWSEVPARQRKGAMEIDKLHEVADLIRCSSRILVLTGAGISASCGIPTFRDAGGFYENVAKEFGLASPEEVNDINTFRKNPLPWFKHVKGIVPLKKRSRSPSLTHQFIKVLQDKGKLLWQYTQNIDCLETAAGIRRVTFCHGSFATATCVHCGYHLKDSTAVCEEIGVGGIPHCRQCGIGVMKPDVVLFNERMPAGVHDGIAQHTAEADLLLVLGTSLKVAPCNLVPSLVGAAGDAQRVLINAELAGSDTDFEHFLQGPSDDTSRALLALLAWTVK